MSNLTHSTLRLVKTSKGTPGIRNSSTDRPHEMNRYMGGHRRLNHPYVSGYWYCVIDPPHRLFDNEDDSVDMFSNKHMEGIYGNQMGHTGMPFETTRWLHSTAESFTPPSRNQTFIEVPGLGGVNSSFLAGQELTRKFTIAFREFQHLPIMNAINTWTSMIDPHYGASPLHGDEYISASYKGSAWIFLCKPSVSGANYNENNFHPDGTIMNPNTARHNRINKDDVEVFYFFEGVFPEAAPFDSLSTDIASNEGAQISVSFSFDGFPYQKEHYAAFNEGLERLNNIYEFNFDGTYNQHIRPSNAPEVYQFPFKSNNTRHRKINYGGNSRLDPN